MTSFNSNQVKISDHTKLVESDVTLRSKLTQNKSLRDIIGKDTANLNDDLGWQVVLGVEVKGAIGNTAQAYQAITHPRTLRIAKADNVDTKVINDFFTSFELNTTADSTIVEKAATSVLKISINNQTDTITITQSQNIKNGNVASSSGSSSSFTSELAEDLAVDDTVAPVADLAIAVDNSDEAILTGINGDIIDIELNAADRAIAIKNTDGIINTGRGADRLHLQARGTESYGIFGGTVNLGDDNDSLIAGRFGGGVNVDAGSGDDLIAGFGKATVDGGAGFDTLRLDAYNREDFVLSFGANNEVDFNLDGITLNTTGFEQFIFAEELTYTYEELATV